MKFLYIFLVCIVVYTIILVSLLIFKRNEERNEGITIFIRFNEENQNEANLIAEDLEKYYKVYLKKRK